MPSTTSPVVSRCTSAFPRDAAHDLAAHLGDVWETDDQDYVLIRDDAGHVLARVPMVLLDEDP